MDLGKCEGCDAKAIGCDDDGSYLCEDCLFEWMSESNMDLEDKFDLLFNKPSRI